MTKKILSVFLALMIAFSVVAVGTSALTASAAVEESEPLGISSDTLYVGQTGSYYITPFYSTVVSSTVTSSNTSVATAYSNMKGEVTVYAKKAGTAVITLKLVSRGSYGSTYTQNASVTITVIGLPSAPANVKIQNKDTGIYVTWNKTSGASKYRVYYKSASDSEWSWDTTYSTSMQLTYLNPGELYYFQVRSIDINDKFGGISKPITLTHVRGTTLNSVVYNSNGSVTVSWDYASGANGYAIAKKKAGDKNYTYIYTSSTTYTDNSVAGGTVYTYQIRPYYTNGKSAAYAQWSNSKSLTTLFKPTITNMNIIPSRLNINWNKIKGANQYKVAFKRSYDSAWNYRTVKTNYYNVPNPTKDVDYYVQVCPMNGTVAGPYSAVKTIRYTSLGTPSVNGYYSGYKNYLYWTAVSGATSYQIAKKSNLDSTYTYYTVTSTSFNDYDYYYGRLYSYQVRACANGSYGSWSNVFSVKTFDTPSIYSLTKSSNKLQMNWYSVSGASYYKVAYKKSTESTWHYQTVSGTQFDLWYPSSNTRYYFQVCPVSSNGIEGPYSDLKSYWT